MRPKLLIRAQARSYRSCPKLVRPAGLEIAVAARRFFRLRRVSKLPRFESAGLSAKIGAPGRTRTCNIRLRRPVLYPVELRAQRWSGWRDSNPRPTAPKAVALPGCATPRRFRQYYTFRTGFIPTQPGNGTELYPPRQRPRLTLPNPERIMRCLRIRRCRIPIASQ